MDSDKAYITDNLYLPKSQIRSQGVINSLTYEKGAVKAWSETDSHLIVPRHYVKEERYPNFTFPFIDLRPKNFPYVVIDSKITWRNHGQRSAFQAMMQNDNGVLNLNTGKGKTVIALQRIVEARRPALIVVHNSYLKEQWIERIHQLLDLGENRIGTIEGNKMDWRHPITICMIMTLSNRINKNALPEGFRDWFGLVIYDEVHHLSAPVFSSTANICLGNRYGLSATPKRADGMDSLVKYHLGDIFYEDMSYDLIPEIKIIETHAVIKETRFDNLFSQITKLTKSKYALGTRYNLLKELYDRGRKIIAISSRLQMMEELAGRFPEEDVCIINAECPIKDRTRLVREKKLIFAIGRLGLEGLDDDNIDTLVFLTPVGGDDTVGESGKEYLGNQIRQGFGRVLRDNGKEKKPEVYFFDDIKIDAIARLNTQAQIFLKRSGFEYKTQEIVG